MAHWLQHQLRPVTGLLAALGAACALLLDAFALRTGHDQPQDLLGRCCAFIAFAFGGMRHPPSSAAPYICDQRCGTTQNDLAVQNHKGETLLFGSSQLEQQITGLTSSGLFASVDPGRHIDVSQCQKLPEAGHYVFMLLRLIEYIIRFVYCEPDAVQHHI
eukprot:1115685-Amphidinium_carterae.2